jgi:hypothetical protein
MIKAQKSQDKKILHSTEFLIWTLDKAKFTTQQLDLLLIPYSKDSMEQYLRMVKRAQEKLIQCKVRVLLISMSKESFQE